MQRKLSAAIQHALAVALVCCASAAVAIWIAASGTVRAPIGAAGEDLRATVLPAVFLLFFTCVIAGGAMWFMQRRQLFARVSGLRRDRAADLLLPAYISGVLLRCWMLLIPALAAVFALMATGEAMLAGMPVVCGVLSLINLPTRGRFERFVEAGVSAHA
jgi:hypothetical protein